MSDPAPVRQQNPKGGFAVELDTRWRSIGFLCALSPFDRTRLPRGLSLFLLFIYTCSFSVLFIQLENFEIKLYLTCKLDKLDCFDFGFRVDFGKLALVENDENDFDFGFDLIDFGFDLFDFGFDYFDFVHDFDDLEMNN